jgi:hypothetical protein
VGEGRVCLIGSACIKDLIQSPGVEAGEGIGGGPISARQNNAHYSLEWALALQISWRIIYFE